MVIADFANQRFCVSLLCIIFSGVLLLLISTLISDDKILTKTVIATNSSIHQFKFATDIHSIQDILYKLPLQLSLHDYATWNEDIIVNNYTFKNLSPSLLMNTLSNKTVLLFGDSTVYRFYVFITYCLDKYIHNKISIACKFNSKLLNYNYTEWDSELWNPNTLLTLIDNIQLLGTKAYKYDAQIINITLIHFENKNNRDIKHLFSLYHSFIQYKPDVIFWNPSGLHLLHLYDVRKFKNHSIEIINRFNDNLMEIYLVAKQLKACLIYRSLSPLCYSKDTTVYQDVRSVYLDHIDDELDHAAYLHFISKCIKESKNSDLCTNWTFTNEGGITKQNKLIKQFVDNAQNKKFGEFNKVFFYDRYHIFHSDPHVCKSEAKDTVHWCVSYGADAMYFANFVDLACG